MLLWYRQESLPLPTLEIGPEGPEVVWKLPVYNRILSIIKNPVYAGAFVYGRRRTRTRVINGRARKSCGHEVPVDQWQVLVRGHHPGYISWEEYLRNQRQLEANAGMHGHMRGGAAKRGQALLAGILRCGRCGRKLHVAYAGNGGRVHRYSCRGAHINHGAAWCVSFGGLRVDEAVSAVVLEALQPAGVEASLRAWEELCEGEGEKRRWLKLAIEKARYEVDLARRQYDAVDPANRLVAGELERRWNGALEHLGELEGRLAETVSSDEGPSRKERERLLELGRDLRLVWNDPGADMRLKKRILRTVLEEIVVDVSEQPSEIVMRMHWAGGVHTAVRVRKNRTGHHRRCTEKEVVDLVRDMARVCDDGSVAATLNRLGYLTGAGNTWTETRVRHLRQYHGIAGYDRSRKRKWITAAEAAVILGISESSTKRLLEAKA